VKPSELGVQVALALARHMSAAGLDDAVCVLPIAERARIAALVGRAEIGAVSFTGSTVAGRSVAVEAARRGKAFVGELGGTNPYVILEDANIERAVGDLVARKLKAAGQACSAPNIVLVEPAGADETVERIASAFDAAAAGPSDTPGYALGPVRSAAALSRLAEHATALERAGARRLGRGVAPPAPEAAYLADPTAYVVDEPGLFFETEMFGPLLGVCVVDGRDALRALLAANRHPLALYVYGADEAGASALVDRLRYGSIGFNTTAIQSPDAPTGGFDGAGVGREGGPWGLREFLTTINMRHGEA
jgi:succinate-semialdehyde dehydrogenase/glutarate-semialdehyde dehydrogenase